MLSLSIEDKQSCKLKLWYEFNIPTSVCRKFNNMQRLRKTKTARLNPYQVNRMPKHFENKQKL